MNVSETLTNSLNWAKSKCDIKTSSSTAYILIIIVAVLIPLLLIYSFKSNKVDSCPLINSELISHINEMHKSVDLKPIPYLQIREALFQKNDKLHAIVQIASAHKEHAKSGGRGIKLIERQNYSAEVKAINSLHTHLLKKRLISGKTNQTISRDEIAYSGIEGDDMLKLLSYVSFLSIKWISYTNPITLRSLLATTPYIMVDDYHHLVDQKVKVITFSLDKGEVKRNIFTMEPCDMNHCHHHYSEVLIMPMELGPHPVGCPCQLCRAGSFADNLCKWVLRRSCTLFPTSRCSLTVRKVSWNSWMKVCGGRNANNNKELYPSTGVLSLLMCH